MTAERLLLDPGLLKPPVEQDVPAWASFWSLIVDWHGDGRLRVGERSLRLATEEFGIYEACSSPLADHEPHGQRDRYRILANILGRVAEGTSEVPLKAWTPDYLGPVEVPEVLHSDLCEVGLSESVGLATRQDYWLEGAASLAVSLEVEASVSLVMEPGGSLGVEDLSDAVAAIAGRRLRIVGGLEDSVVADHLREVFLFGSVSWVECEKHKNPKIDSLNQVTDESDIVICITGKIGHSAFKKLKKTCAPCVVHVCERIADIEELLRSYR